VIVKDRKQSKTLRFLIKFKILLKSLKQ